MKRRNAVASGLRRLAATGLALAIASVVAIACVPGGGEDPPGGDPPGGGSAQPGLAGCPTLHPGDQDPVDGTDCVAALQQALRDNGYPDQGLDGQFGSGTKANVIDFQAKNGLTADGVVGGQTRDALLSTGGGGGGGGGGQDPPAEARIVAGCAPENSLGATCPITGSGFAPGEKVRLDFFLPAGGASGDAAVADDQGAFTFTFTNEPHIANTGTIHVVATGEQSKRTANAQFIQDGSAGSGPAEIHCVRIDNDGYGFTYAGSGFGANEPVEVTIAPDSNDPETISETAHDDGSIQRGINYPVKQGIHIGLRARGRTTGREASSTVYWAGPSSTSTKC